MRFKDLALAVSTSAKFLNLIILVMSSDWAKSEEVTSDL